MGPGQSGAGGSDGFPLSSQASLIYDYVNRRFYTRDAALNTGFTEGTFASNHTLTNNGNGSFVGSNGRIQQQAANLPRYDYNPVTLAANGLLVEEARTNLILRSNDFTNVVWGKNNSTITGDTTTSPDGTANADTITATATSLAYVSQDTAALTTGLNYTATACVKAGSKNFFAFAFFGHADVFFDLVNLTTNHSGANFVSADIKDIGNGWRKVTATWTKDAGATYRLFMAIASSLSSFSGLTIGDTLFYYGAELDQGSFSDSLIPTAASSVTRTIDANSHTLGSEYNAAAGTYIVTAIAPNNTTANATVLQIDDGTNNNRIRIYRDTSGHAICDVVVAGVSQASFDLGAWTALTSAKIGIGFSANSFKACMNGGAVSTDVSGSVPTVTTLRAGQNATSAEVLNSTIALIEGFPTLLSDANLRAALT